jgi:hypothetical protein
LPDSAVSQGRVPRVPGLVGLWISATLIAGISALSRFKFHPPIVARAKAAARGRR